MVYIAINYLSYTVRFSYTKMRSPSVTTKRVQDGGRREVRRVVREVGRAARRAARDNNEEDERGGGRVGGRVGDESLLPISK